MDVSLDDVRGWDKADALRWHRAAFALPEGVIYLDGNSLGPLPVATGVRLARVVDAEWGSGLIGSWDGAGWMAAPARVGAKIARLVGAEADEVIAADSTSVNLFKLCAAACGLRPGRRTLLTQDGDFPTDRYVLEGLARLLPQLRVLSVPQAELVASMDSDTAVVLLCHVHYRSGALLDMAALTGAAQAAGALAVWDLSHSVGAVPVNLAACGVQLAAGCGYKFLNGGPGAPAFLYVARGLDARSPLQGWIGHDAPFRFDQEYTPAGGVRGFQAGTPSVLGLAALESGLDVFLAADAQALWGKSARMFDLFAGLTGRYCPGLALITPSDQGARGSQIAFRCAEAERVMKALIAHKVIGDFRPPDVLRFGLTPLYTNFEDIFGAVQVLQALLGER